MEKSRGCELFLLTFRYFAGLSFFLRYDDNTITTAKEDTDMNRTETAPAPRRKAAAPAAPVCRVAKLGLIPEFPLGELGYCPVPTEDKPDALLRAFRAAPQFSRISYEELLRGKTSENFRVILMGENDYYLRQAAMYLTALSQSRNRSNEEEDDWEDLELDMGEYLIQDPADKSEVMKQSVAVIEAKLLDPEITRRNDTAAASSLVMKLRESDAELDLMKIQSLGILLRAESGAVLSDSVVGKLSVFLEKRGAQDIFIALRSDQVEKDLLEELRFAHDFQICTVGEADDAYLHRLFCECAREVELKLDAKADIGAALSRLRRYRGKAFSEEDIHHLLRHMAKKKKPLATEDLLVQPFRSRESGGREALHDMIGLAGVKSAVERLLATAIMEDRRRAAGVSVPVSCRNLAFAGSPGTGKSVTARLVAEILRAEGCGSGRFVEAGREQLIGGYLGQTSHMIAELFRAAKGGVLFIDEAGALLSGSRDIYATEAINALVRHMELEPETMVIFATYSDEMKRLLAANPGLSSRVAQVVEFPDYEEKELFEIFHSFARKEKLPLSRSAEEICDGYFRELRRRKGKNFGNGREARRLFNAAKEELALRTLGGEGEYAISSADLKNAAERLLTQEQSGNAKTIGF